MNSFNTYPHFKWTTLLPILLIVFCPALYAQKRTTQFTQVGRAEGLSQSTVRAIVQDSQGFLWFGTQNGLNRYDGIGFTTFHKDDSPLSLSSDFILRLASDPRGYVWIGTKAGLDCYDYRSNKIRAFRKSKSGLDIPEALIAAILPTPEGSVWLASNQGIIRLLPSLDKIIPFFPSDYPELKGGVSTLTLKDPNHIWVGTRQGKLLILDIEKSSFDEVPAYRALGFEGSAIDSIALAPDGHVWVAPFNRGAVLISPDGLSAQPFSPDSPDVESVGDSTFNTIYTTRNGDTWFGGIQNGLSRCKGTKGPFEHFLHDGVEAASLPNNQVLCLFEDSGGLLWVGTNEGAAKLFPPNDAVRHYSHIINDANSLSHNRVKSFCEDQQGILWIGTYGGGLNALDRQAGQFTRYLNDPQTPDSLSSDNVFALFEDDHQRLWVGTFGGGLNLMDRQTGTFRTLHEGTGKGTILHDYIVHLSQGPFNRMWIGTRKGLALFDPETELSENIGNRMGGPGEDFIRVVVKGKRDQWWIGTFSSGLYGFEEQTGAFRNYRNDPNRATSLAENNVDALLFDSKDRLWLGTSGGLELFDPTSGEFQHFRQKDGLPSNTINGLLEDDQGRLWISADNGLCRMDTDKKTFTHFGPRNGLMELEFNASAALKTQAHELVFGGISGFSIFPPESMKCQAIAPRVVLTSFKILNQEVPLPIHISETEKISVSYKDSVISFEFAALDFSDPAGNRYAYRLDGFDKDWQSAGSRNFAGYTNLDPGNYTLRVRAANGNGAWSEKTAQVKLEVVPPFYRTKLFYLVVMVTIGLLFWAWLWNYRRQRDRLNQLIRDRTHSLEVSNQELLQTAENLRSTQKKLLDSAHKVGMAEIASDVLHNMGNALNGIMVSATVVDQQLDNLKIQRLKRLSGLLNDHQADLTQFLNEQGRAAMVLEMLERLSEDLEQARTNARQEVRELHTRGLEMIAILRYQRKYALGEEFYEDVRISDLLEDVLQIQSARLEELAVQVIKSFAAVETLALPRSKLLNVFNHLVKNSCDSMELGSTRGSRKMVLTIRTEGYHAFISVQDNGIGIKAEHLDRIFTAGFSTKPNSAGIGLHHCANALNEIGGTMYALSEGPGKGATFCLEIPLKLERKSTGQIV